MQSAPGEAPDHADASTPSTGLNSRAAAWTPASGGATPPWAAAPSWTPPAPYQPQPPSYGSHARSPPSHVDSAGVPSHETVASYGGPSVGPVAMTGHLEAWGAVDDDDGDEDIADGMFDEGTDDVIGGTSGDAAAGERDALFAIDPDFDATADALIVVRDAPSAQNGGTPAALQAGLLREMRAHAPWTSAVRVALDARTGVLFAEGSRAGAEGLFRATNGMVTLLDGLPRASHIDWPTPQERDVCSALVQRARDAQAWRRLTERAVTDCEGAARSLLAVTQFVADEGHVGSCINGCPDFVPSSDGAVPRFGCPRCECCAGCGCNLPPKSHGTHSCPACGHHASPPATAAYGGIAVESAAACAEDAVRAAGQLARWLSRMQLDRRVIAGTTRDLHSGRPAVAVLWPLSHHGGHTPADVPEAHRDAAVTRALQSSGFFPTLNRVLCEHFDLAPAEAASPVEFLLTATLWLLLRLPGNADVLREGFTVFGGAIRDFVLRRVWPIEDIDVACPLCRVRAPSDSQSGDWLMGVLQRALSASPEPIRRHIGVEPAPAKPGVPERVLVRHAFATVAVELVDASNFADTTSVDMTFNNVELTRHGLRQKFPSQGGGCLLTTLRDIFQRRGLAETLRNEPYQRRRRQRRELADTEMRRFRIDNVNDADRCDGDPKTERRLYAAYPPTHAMREHERHRFLSIHFAADAGTSCDGA